VKTIRQFFNNAEAEFARSLLTSVGIEAVLADGNANTLGPGFAPGGVRLQVPDEDVARAMEILDGEHQEFPPLPEEFVPQEEVSGESETDPPPLEGFGKVRELIPAGLCLLAAMGALYALFLLLAPLSWTHSSAELVHLGVAAAKAKDAAKALKYYDAALIANPHSDVVYFDRGLLFYRKKEYEKAIEDFTKAIQFPATFNPRDSFKSKLHLPQSYNMRARSFQMMGRYDKALEDFNHAVQLSPGESLDCNNLAWLYATCPKAEIRNGAKALELAMKACYLSDWKKWNRIGTLAAAEAETGDFDAALKYAQQALTMAKAEKTTDEKALKQLTDSLAEYQQKRPYRDLNK